MRTPAVLLLAAAAALAQSYSVHSLQSPPKIEYLISRDLDGDGLDDLCVLNGREAWIWRGRAERFPIKPDRKLSLPEGTALFDFAARAGGGARLIARTSEGYYAVEADGTQRVAGWRAGPGLPDRPANVLWRSLFLEDRLVDVSLDGYAIGGKVTLPPVITERTDTRGGLASGRWHARYALARWTAGRFDGDDRTDFAVVVSEGLIVYPSDESGGFSPDRVTRIELPEARDSDLKFLDLDGDRRTDALALRTKEGRATILRADPEKGLAAAQRTPLSVAGEMQPPVITDLNGDGLPDLALPYLARPSVPDAVRVALRGELLVRVAIFLNSDGSIPTRADRRLTVPVRIRLVTDSAGRILLSGLVVAEYGGDLDGDGIRDLLVSRQPDLLAVYRGGGPEVYAETESETIPIPDSGRFDSVRSAAANLNGDRRSDIILHYRGTADRPDQLHVLVSRKN